MADINGIPNNAMSTSFFAKILVSTVPSFVTRPLTHLVNLVVVALVFLLLGMLTGCSSTSSIVPDQDASTTNISVATYRRIDQDIWDASALARADAEAYAQRSVQHWANKVWEQTKKDFIPWYVDYWTQQGLIIKYTWYQINESGETATATERLATHLKEQFSERVLKLVALETDPEKIADEATSIYIRVLANQIRVIPDRYQIPVAAFHGKLKVIPAIDLSTRPPQNASLYQILTSDNLVAMPAYKMLVAGNYSPGNGIESRSTRSKLDAVAKQATDKLAEKIALRGGGAAAAAIAGGGIGILISTGFTAWSIIEHEKDRPSLEAELSENLWSALNETSRILLEDRDQGVLAAVHHMSSHIENNVWSAPFFNRLMEEDPPENGEDIDSLF